MLDSSEELRLFRGEDYRINDHVTVHIPTLGEISDFGENKYFSMVRSLTATPCDMCWQLAKSGKDFTEITEWELFSQVISRRAGKDMTGIILGDLDLSALKLRQSEDTGSIVLAAADNSWYFDEGNYILLTDCLRSLHRFSKNDPTPGNEAFKEFLIEDAREAYENSLQKEPHSTLLNLISSMVNSEGFKYNHRQVWDLKINTFIDSVMRINKIQNAIILLQSGYSGFGVDLSKINKNQLNWMGGLD